MSNRNPVITIGITAWREGEALRECWDSVLAQTDDRWTAVLVLDGDADEATRRVFDQLSDQRLVKEASDINRGPYPNRNRAFELTRTPLHFYLDGDDQLPAEAVHHVLQVAAAHPDAGIIYGDYQQFGDRQDLLRWPMAPRPNDFVFGQPIPGACVYRRDVWQHLGGFAAELARGNADYDFHLGACERDVISVHCGKVFYHYRRTARGSVSTQYARRIHETHAIMVERHPRFFADRRRRDRFLGLGHLQTAVALWNAGQGDEAKKHAELALVSHRLAVDVGAWGAVGRVLSNLKLRDGRRSTDSTPRNPPL